MRTTTVTTVGSGYLYFVPWGVPRYRVHRGWLSCRFAGRRHQLYGGMRGGFFVNLDRPII